MFHNKQKEHEMICKLDSIIRQNNRILDYLERIDSAIPETVQEADKFKAVSSFVNDFIKDFDA